MVNEGPAFFFRPLLFDLRVGRCSGLDSWSLDRCFVAITTSIHEFPEELNEIMRRRSIGSLIPIAPTASPMGEEEPGPEGAERGGYLPIPRRDARAGEWVFLI